MSRGEPFIKDPQDVLDYPMNWAPFLDGDTILTSTWIVPTGITSAQETDTDTGTVIWLSGGTLSARYALTNRITTTGGRTKDWTIYIRIEGQ